jgi:hypothetical protein
MVIITGSATKVIRVLSFMLGTQSTNAHSETLFLIKRNGLNSGGTFVPNKMVRNSTNDPMPTATVGHYTLDPVTLGNAVGTINIVRTQVPSGDATGGTWSGLIFQTPVELLPWIDGSVKPVTLRGIEESLVCNFNGAANQTGYRHLYRIVWTEENA